MRTRVVILGAGFAGLELSSRLSAELAGQVDVTLIDQSDSFLFGFAKLDVMFGRRTMKEVRIPYRTITKPGVTFRQESVLAIDPELKQVVTDAGGYEADVLVVALGADLDPGATPGLDECGHEFYSPGGAARVRDLLPVFPGWQRGHRRARRVVQVPARALRDRGPAPRLPVTARDPQRHHHSPHHPDAQADPDLGGDVGRPHRAARQAGHPPLPRLVHHPARFIQPGLQLARRQHPQPRRGQLDRQPGLARPGQCDQRDPATKARTAASSPSRPMKLDTGAGRLCSVRVATSPGLPRRG
jgi:glycine/D-amino acid oxidase-like deaminating enzyme